MLVAQPLALVDRVQMAYGKHPKPGDGVPAGTKREEGRLLHNLWKRKAKRSQADFLATLELSGGYLPQFFRGLRPITLELAEAIAEVNDSAYGLQVGVFTRDLPRAMQAWDDAVVGGVVINDIPSWRVDHMPYGGVKDSGLGREGIRWAIESMTEVKLLVIRTTK